MIFLAVSDPLSHRLTSVQASSQGQCAVSVPSSFNRTSMMIDTEFVDQSSSMDIFSFRVSSISNYLPEMSFITVQSTFTLKAKSQSFSCSIRRNSSNCKKWWIHFISVGNFCFLATVFICFLEPSACEYLVYTTQELWKSFPPISVESVLFSKTLKNINLAFGLHY